MYNSFFGFRAKPFNNEPELRFHYVTPSYADAFNAIRVGLRSGHGLYCLTGPEGSGKTILLQRLVAAAANQGIQYALCSAQPSSLTELLEQACQTLEIPVTGQSFADKLKWLQASCTERLQQGLATVLVIDDAHQFDENLLSELLQACFCDSEPSEQALQILLLGHPKLANVVTEFANALQIEAVNQYQLQLLSDVEVPNYITQQLRAAGYQGNTIFSPKALETITQHAEGSLRKLSLLCDASLINAYLQSLRQITPEIVVEAAQQHSIEGQEKAPAARQTDPIQSASAAAPAASSSAPVEQQADTPVSSNTDYITHTKDEIAIAPPNAQDSKESIFNRINPVHLLPSSKESIFSRIDFVHLLPIAVGGIALFLGVGIMLAILFSEDQNTIPVATSQQQETPLLIPDTTESTALATAEPTTTAITTTADETTADETAQTETNTSPALTTNNTLVTTATTADTQQQSASTPETPTATVSTKEPAQPATTQTITIEIPQPNAEAEVTADPRIVALLGRAADQIRNQQLIEPEGNNALETYLEVLKLQPGNNTALAGLRQLNQFYFAQLENAQQARESYYQEAESARQEQRRYLDQLLLAKQEKEQYLRDLSEYYVGQAILANRYKVDSLVQAEIARQNTTDYLTDLTNNLSQNQNRRPPRQQNTIVSSQPPPPDPQQAQLQAGSKIDRLLARAQQQLAKRRFIRPKRDSALDTYRQVLQLDPANLQALDGIEYIMKQYLKWAENAAALSNPQRARYFLDQAMEVDPNNRNLAARLRDVRQQVIVAEQAISGTDNKTANIGRGSTRSSPTSATRNLSATPQMVEALMQSAAIGDIRSVNQLLSSGTPANISDRRGNSALMIAAQHGHPGVISALLRRGAKVNDSNPFNETALMIAALNGHDSVVEVLLANGASPSARDADGRTALINACSKGYYDVARILLSHGADPNTKSKTGRTALMVAAWNGYPDLVQLLLTEGNVDINIKNNEGWTALSHAAWQGYAEIAQLLIEYGADVNTRSNNGETALVIAANRGHARVVQLLQ